MKVKKSAKPYIQTLLLGMAMTSVVFSHFAVSQFISFQSEKDAIMTEVIDKQRVEIKTEFEAKRADVPTTSKKTVPVSSNFEPETNRTVPKQTVMKQTETKKKEVPRESKAERLRRAERLLTGV